MIRTVSLGIAVALGAVSATALAVEDPILTRQKLMWANGAAVYGVASRMMREEIPFNSVVAASILQTANAVAYSFGDYFPEGSQTGGETRASPRIWEDMEGFMAELQNFQQVTDAALAAEPETLDAFREVFVPVAESCDSCHDQYRLERD